MFLSQNYNFTIIGLRFQPGMAANRAPPQPALGTPRENYIQIEPRFYRNYKLSQHCSVLCYSSIAGINHILLFLKRAAHVCGELFCSHLILHDLHDSNESTRCEIFFNFITTCVRAAAVCWNLW